MIEYKYTRHIWTKDDDFLYHAERTLGYMACGSDFRPLCSMCSRFEYDLLDTPQKRFSYVIARLVDRSVEYFNVTDPDLWAHLHLPHIMTRDTATTDMLARLFFIFHHSLHLSGMTRAYWTYTGSDRKYILMEDDPVRMFLFPKAYTLDGMSTTVHSQVFGGQGVELVPWDETEGMAWLLTDFNFELFTLISRTLEDMYFFKSTISHSTYEYNRTDEDGGIHGEPCRIEPRGSQAVRTAPEGGA